MGDSSTTEDLITFPDTVSSERTGEPRGGRIVSWLLLLVLTVPLLIALKYAAIPGSLLIGSLAAGIAMAIWRGALRMPKVPYDLSQGLMACFVARSITPATVHEFIRYYPIFLGMVIVTIAMSTMCGLWLTRRGRMTAQSAVFGSFPGAAPAMVLIATNSGADARMVAVMQYARIVIVAMSTAFAGFFYLNTGDLHPVAVSTGMAVDGWRPLVTVLFAALASFAGDRTGISAGTFLVPLGCASLLSGSGSYVFAVPMWLTTPCFVLIGWSIGLQFDYNSFRFALRALPYIVLTIVVLIGGCLLSAMLLSTATGMDLMTTYLATSPGGLDAAVIIAASTHADGAFVTGLQTTRLVFVLAFGPAIAKWVVRRVAGASGRTG